MKRKRAHIPLAELLASALADKLPQAQRDALRELRGPARDVIRLFTPDHIQLHAFGGADKWWNIDMRLRDFTLKLKDAADTRRVAKDRRLHATWDAFTRKLSKPKPRKRKRKSKSSRWQPPRWNYSGDRRWRRW